MAKRREVEAADNSSTFCKQCYCCVLLGMNRGHLADFNESKEQKHSGLNQARLHTGTKWSFQWLTDIWSVPVTDCQTPIFGQHKPSPKRQTNDHDPSDRSPFQLSVKASKPFFYVPPTQSNSFWLKAQTPTSGDESVKVRQPAVPHTCARHIAWATLDS